MSTSKSRGQADQTSLGRTRVAAEGGKKERGWPKQAFSQEAECGDQRKMTEAIQDEKQEDSQKKDGWRARSR